MQLRAAVVAMSLAGCGGFDDTDLGTAEQATTVCGSGAVVQGMDVSAYETSIDFTAAKAAGIEFAFIRATDGTQYTDPKFVDYWAGARAAGVLRGAYQFFRPAEDPIAQADLLLSILGTPEAGDLPPVIDVETTGGLPPADVAANVQQWVEHVTAAIGRPPIIYAGFYSWQDDVGGADLTAYPLWHAQYTPAPCPNLPVPWTAWTFWQYSSTGHVPAVIGETTDLDVFNGTRAELAAFAAGDAPPCGTIAAAGGEIDNADACFATGGPAATLRAVSGAGEGGDLIWTRTTTDALVGNFARWELDLAEAGSYRIEVATAAAYAQATTAAYDVVTADATQTVTIDQTAVDGWQPLGDFTLAAGGGQHVALADNTGIAGEQLVFDALRLTRLDAAAGSGSGYRSEPPRTDDSGCAAGGRSGVFSLLFVLAALTRCRRLPHM